MRWRSGATQMVLALCVTGLVGLTGCESHKTASMNTGVQPSETANVSTSGEMTTISRAFPTGDPSTSSVMLTETIPTQVQSGQPFNYQVKVENLTDKPLQDVRVIDQLSNNLRISHSDVQFNQSPNGATVYALGTLQPHQTKTFNVNATSTGANNINSCALVQYNQTLCATIPVVNPRLSLNANVPNQAMACDTIPVQFTVANNGTGTAKNVQIREQLPDGLTTTNGNNQFTLDAGDIPAGQSKTATVELKAARTGQFTLTPNAAGYGNLTANASQQINVVQPSLTIQASNLSSTSTYAGRPITYNVTVTNNSNVPARNAMLVNTLGTSGGAQLVNASDSSARPSSDEANKVRYDLGDLQPGQSKTIKVQMTAGQPGQISNYLWAGAECARPAQTSVQAHVKGAAGVLVTVGDAVDPIPVGDTETYTIIVTNQGNIPDTNVHVTAKLDNNMQFVSASGASTGTNDNGTINFEPIQSLAPHQTVRWEVQVKGNKASQGKLAVQMKDDQLNTPVNSEEATNYY